MGTQQKPLLTNSLTTQIQGFELSHTDIYPFYDLLEYKKGPILGTIEARSLWLCAATGYPLLSIKFLTSLPSPPPRVACHICVFCFVLWSIYWAYSSTSVWPLVWTCSLPPDGFIGRSKTEDNVCPLSQYLSINRLSSAESNKATIPSLSYHSLLADLAGIGLLKPTIAARPMESAAITP